MDKEKKIEQSGWDVTMEHSILVLDRAWRVFET